MNEPRPLIIRLFSWIWAIIVFCFRATVVLSLVLIGFAIWGGSKATHTPIAANLPMTLIPAGELADQIYDDRGRDFLRQFSDAKPTKTSLRQLIEALDSAAHDSRIPFVVVDLSNLDAAGLPQLEELAVAMRNFRAAGKPIYAYGESFDQRQYYLAAQADEISLDPMGSVLLEGVSVYTNYFKDALDKLGVQVNIFRVGEYKSAVEPYERNNMSPEARAANEAWLGDLWKNYGQVVGKARGLSDDAVDRYITGLNPGLAAHNGDAAAYALDAKLVNKIETRSEFRKRMIEKVGENRDGDTFRQIDYGSYLTAVAAESKAKAASSKIAVVTVQGEIVDGDGDERSAGGDDIAAQLDRARRADDVEAVILRVNSPGGSVVASEKIRRGVQALRADGKPVVASMSTLAASGGYWVSMEADQIWAEPTTITGSIGIFGMIPTISEPLNRIGIHTDGVGTTPLSGAFRIDRPLSSEVKGLFQKEIERGYREFIEGVSKGRNIPVKQVDAIARGRVWSGQAAKELGLVDEIGGFAEAEAAAAKLAELEPGSYDVEELQSEHNYWSQIVGRLLGNGHADYGRIASLLPAGPLTDEVNALGVALARLDDPKRIYAYCFCSPDLGR